MLWFLLSHLLPFCGLAISQTKDIKNAYRQDNTPKPNVLNFTTDKITSGTKYSTAAAMQLFYCLIFSMLSRRFFPQFFPHTTQWGHIAKFF